MVATVSAYTIGEHSSANNQFPGGLDKLLRTYNAVISGAAPTNTGYQVTQEINLALFNNDPTKQIHFQYDSATSATATDAFTGGPGQHLFLEFANNGSGDLTFTTNGQSDVIVLGSDNAVNFVDAGSVGDNGDIIVGGNANQSISVTSGANTVVAGGGQDTIYGGSGADSLVGGGNTWVQGGTGSQTLLGGLSATSHDTLVAGTGADLLKAKFGDNTIYAGLANGHGTDTVVSRDNGGDSIALNNGGNVFVSIGSGSGSDTVSFGLSSGDDTIHTNGGAVDIYVSTSESLTGIQTNASGQTVISFQDGQHLTYSGNNITLTFH